MGGRLRRGVGPFGRKKCPPEPAPAGARAAAAPSSPDSVLARLDQIDLRLRQLEQNQIARPPPPLLPPVPESYFSADLRKAAEAACLSYNPQQQQQQQKLSKDRRQQKPPASSSMSSAIREVCLRGSLMDRLRLLESRILQLSFELGDRSSSSGASSSTTRMTSSSESAWALQSASSSAEENRVTVAAAVPSRKLAVGLAPWKLGLGHRLHRRMSRRRKGKDPKEALEAAEKKASDACKENKRTRIYRRWFPVGC